MRTEKPETHEARAILQLVSHGTTTLEGARELIGVPEQQKRVLKAFITTGGKAGVSVGCALRFREKVLQEFDRLTTSEFYEVTN
jgi:hypothetical protein